MSAGTHQVTVSNVLVLAEIWAAKGGSEVPVTGCIQADVGRSLVTGLIKQRRFLGALGPLLPSITYESSRRGVQCSLGVGCYVPFLVSGGSSDPPSESPVCFWGASCG